MKKNLSLLSKGLVPLLFFFGACQDTDIDQSKGTPRIIPRSNLAAQREASNFRGTNQNDEVYVFAGDNLYAVERANGNVTLIGIGWSGTEAATIYNDDIYGVVGGHLWRYDLFTGAGADLGPDWGGTSLLTNDNAGNLYAIQGGLLWKVNASNGNWSQLGSGIWVGSTTLNYSVSGGWLYIQQGSMRYRVNRQNGTWEEFDIPKADPLVMNIDDNRVHGIMITPGNEGFFGGGSAHQNNFSPCGLQIWAGATGLTVSFIDINQLISLNYFILKDEVLTQLENPCLNSTIRTISIPSSYMVVGPHGL